MSTGHSGHQAVTTPESFGPVRPSERMALLDVLRGFAILGIIFVNNSPANLFRKVLFPSAPELFGHTLVYILGVGKLWPLFALLFGVGFAIQLERAGARGVNIIPTYLRRLLFLALLGCVLNLLIHVPQLLNLAIAGVPMLFIGFGLRRRPSSSLLAVALALLALYLSKSIPTDLARDRGLSGPPDVAPEVVAAHVEEIRADFDAEAEQAVSWNLDRLSHRVQRMLRFYVSLPRHVVQVWGYPNYVAYMLVGIFLWRMGVFLDPPRHRRFFLRLLAVSLPIGLASAIYVGEVNHAWFLTRIGLGRYPTPFVRVIYSPTWIVASLGMALTYTSSIALLMQHTMWARMLNLLAPVGRMALTNYALQALLPALLFGQYTAGIPPMTLGVWFSITILIGLAALQVMFSSVWLRSYQFGPLEWLWRTLTYWELQPIRKQRTHMAEAKSRVGADLR